MTKMVLEHILKKKYFGSPSIQTPKELGYRMPAEWEKHSRTWLARPHLKEEWGACFEEAIFEWTNFAKQIANAGEPLKIVTPDQALKEETKKSLEKESNTQHEVNFVQIPYGDAWVRDTGPVFITNKKKELGAVCFAFDGWGGSFDIAGDKELGPQIAKFENAKTWAVNFVLEGGAIEVDGQGTCLLNETCILDPKRNPEVNKQEVEWLLSHCLAIEHFIWVSGALFNDHTDGHIDTLARFIGPEKVVCMKSSEASDPNKDVLENISMVIEQSTNADGKKISVKYLPSPGKIQNTQREILPASYCNFYITNDAVFVPVYGVKTDKWVLEKLKEFYSKRKIIAVDCRAIITGGGALHCISKQVPEHVR